MSKKDYIPSGDGKFLDWAKKMVEYAKAENARFQVPMPSTEIDTNLRMFDAWYRKCQSSNRGKVDTLEKDAVRKVLEKECRTYVQGFLAKNPFVTDADRENMGLTVYDTIPTPVQEPEGQAEADITYPGRTQLQLHIKHVAGTPFNPKASYGYRVYYGVYDAADTPPGSGMDLRESKFTRQKKMMFRFLPGDSAKTAYFCIRYENSKGQTGPWGALFSAVIP
jgi:hypothetical protein